MSRIQTVFTTLKQQGKMALIPYITAGLLKGLDDICLTMQQQDKIKAFEAKHQQAQPWLFN